jgi:beta-lactamase class A
MKQDELFPMQSVFKLPIAIEVLRQVDEGKIELDHEILLGADDAREGVTMIVVSSRATVRKLLEAMVVSSDNVACDRLLALVGGPQAVDGTPVAHKTGTSRTHSRSYRFEQFLDSLLEPRNLDLNGRPHQFEVHAKVLVNEHVTHARDLTPWNIRAP